MRAPLPLAALLLATSCSRNMTISDEDRPGAANKVLAAGHLGCYDGFEYVVLFGNTAQAAIPHYKTPTEVYRCGESSLYQQDQRRQARERAALGE